MITCQTKVHKHCGHSRIKKYIGKSATAARWKGRRKYTWPSVGRQLHETFRANSHIRYPRLWNAPWKWQKKSTISDNTFWGPENAAGPAYAISNRPFPYQDLRKNCSWQQNAPGWCCTSLMFCCPRVLFVYCKPSVLPPSVLMGSHSNSLKLWHTLPLGPLFLNTAFFFIGFDHGAL